ncbi:glycosyltransferase family 4 protein [Polaribacter sp.]|nr:glycosyltransferase family 4 protein [Polaribacter sp.]
MKVLIITYYWPPAGGSGVQRWLKFVKYLRDFGIEPIVYTVENANYIKEDVTLAEEIPEGITVLKQPTWQPEQLLFWKKKKKNQQQVATLTSSKFLSFIRGNFFIPDPKVFWVKKSVNFLKEYVQQENIDAIVSTGPPHSMHLIALKLKQKTAVKWLADFRDPWSDLYYNQDFNHSSIAKRIHKDLEKKVLEQADLVTTVSNSLKELLQNKASNVQVITNGFDEEVTNESTISLDAKFTISYIGLLPKQSHSDIFFKVIQSLIENNKEFKRDIHLNFVGDICDEVKKSVEKYNLQNFITFHGYVAHKKAIEFQKKSQVLLLLIPNVIHNEGILTGKLFEYLTTERPILAIGPKGADLEKILSETKTGTVIEHNNEKEISEEILKLYELYTANTLKVTKESTMQFHRRELTKQLAIQLKQLIN